MSRQELRLFEIKLRMQELSEESTSEEGHSEADNLVEEALVILGQGELAAYYSEVGKWFA